MGICYTLTGTKENPPILFLHGFMGNGNDWNETVSYLSEKYYCITLDLPGHGNSNNLERLNTVWDFDSLCNRLSGLLNHLKIQKVSLVGYSMGGRIALYFAHKYPQLLTHLILESASPGIKTNDKKEIRLKEDKALSQKLKNEPLEEILEKWYSLPLFSGIKNHPKYKALFLNRLKNDPTLLAKAVESFSPGRQVYLMNKMKNLKMSVNLICGENDIKYTDVMKKIKRDNLHFNLKIFRDCGHNVHFEKPDLFAEHLLLVLSL